MFNLYSKRNLTHDTVNARERLANKPSTPYFAIIATTLIMCCSLMSCESKQLVEVKPTTQDSCIRSGEEVPLSLEDRQDEPLIDRDSKEATLIISVSLLIGVVCYIWGAYRCAGDLKWFSPLNLARRHQKHGFLILGAVTWVSFLLAASVFALCLLGKLVNRTFDFLASPGMMFMSFVACATLWSLANTLAILSRQRSTFNSFMKFYHELKNIVKDIEGRMPPPSPGKIRPSERAILVDYSVTIGDVSKIEIVDHVTATLGRLRGFIHCESHFLVLCENKLQEFYNRFLQRGIASDEDWQGKIGSRMAKAVQVCNDLDMQGVAIWRSDKIHSEHYLVSTDAALQYLVLQRENGRENEITGELTQDEDRVKYLELMVHNYLRDAVTPDDVRIESEKLKVSFPIKQQNIEKILLFFGNSREKLPKPGFVPDHDDKQTRDIPVNGPLLRETEYLYPLEKSRDDDLLQSNFLVVQLLKTHGIASILSNPVQIGLEKKQGLGNDVL